MRSSLVLMLSAMIVLAGSTDPAFQPVFAQMEWIEHTITDDFDYANSIHACDLDGDGNIDFLGVAAHGDEVSWWENVNGDGLTLEEHPIDPTSNSPYQIHAGDLDGDGDLDIVCAERGADAVIWWENVDGDGLNLLEHAVDAAYDAPSHVHAVDMDGDGDIDVLGASYIGDRISWWENVDGSGTNWIEYTVTTRLWSLRNIAAADMDGDGDTDVLSADWLYDEIVWYENVTDGQNWPNHVVIQEFYGAEGVDAMDMDGDGDIDIVGAGSRIDEIRWWENLDGSGLILEEHLVAHHFFSVGVVHAADLDGDGDGDIIAVPYDSYHSIWWFENLDGDGTVWIDNPLSGSFYSPMEVCSADIDGDGDLDVASASSLGDKLAWWEHGDQITPVQVSITHAIPGQTIPPGGGHLLFNVAVSNDSGSPYPCDIWTEAQTPGNNFVGPLEVVSVTIPDGATVSNTLSQTVPGWAPQGYYRFHINLGCYNQNEVESTDWISFVKTGTASSTIDSWQSSSLRISKDELETETSNISTDFVLLAPYPNPFNDATTVTVWLPETAELHVVVYDILGQQVVILTDGAHAPGLHRFTFDASNVASGLYFIRATVPGQLNQVQKVMLVR